MASIAELTVATSASGATATRMLSIRLPPPNSWALTAGSNTATAEVNVNKLEDSGVTDETTPVMVMSRRPVGRNTEAVSPTWASAALRPSLLTAN